MARIYRNLLDRFMDKVSPEPNSGCWLWTANALPAGYGLLWDVKIGKAQYAHRIAFELFKGPIPKGFDVDHKCRVPCCVNPAHLEAVTHKENCRRGLHGRLCVNCPQGHAYSEENTYTDSKGLRHCRTCTRIRKRDRYRAAKTSSQRRSEIGIVL